MRIIVPLGILGLVISIIFSTCSDPSHPIISTKEFVLPEGLRIEQVSSSELLENPVAMEIDQEGRIWVAELTGYMRDIDGVDEDVPDGRISILKDNDGDGVMDSKKVFLDELKTPRALLLINGGLLFAEPPNLWWTKINKDQPTKLVLVDSLYALEGNIEHMANGLLYNVDNWIYNARSNRRYQLRSGEWHIEATTMRGQWGITNDQYGRLYYNDNSNLLYGDRLGPNQFPANRFQKISHGEVQKIAQNNRVHPYQPTSVNRGYIPGVLDAKGLLVNATSACGPLVYKGGAFPSFSNPSAFVCLPEINTVKRLALQSENGRVYSSNSDTIEFLISKDQTFRPVNLTDGPEGSLAIVDMRKPVIQHNAYMTSYLREIILSKGEDTISNGGRLYLVSAGQKVEIPDRSNYKVGDWISLLNSENYFDRIQAQKKLIYEFEPVDDQALVRLARDNSNSLSQLHALYTLCGRNELLVKDLLQIGRTASDPGVMALVCQLSSEYFDPVDRDEWKLIFQSAIDMNHPFLDLQLCHSLPKLSDDEFIPLIKNLLSKYGNDPMYCEAVISGNQDVAMKLVSSTKDLDSLKIRVQNTLLNERNNITYGETLDRFANEDDRTTGWRLFAQNCATCHGRDGKGIAQLGPPIYGTKYGDAPSEHLILIALHGMQGPIQVGDKTLNFEAIMPGIKDNPSLSDEDIKDILLYVRNGFASTSHETITTKQVTQIRNKTIDRQAPMSEEILETWQITEIK